MFGLLQKMDRYSNKLMSEDEKIDFMQEIVDNGIVWDMHKKYVTEALDLIDQGKVIEMAIRRKVKNPEPVVAAERPSSPFWRSICY